MLVCAPSCLTLCNRVDCSPPCSSVHVVGSSGKNTGVGCHFLLQGIFPTQGSNPSLLHWQVDCLPLSHLGSLLVYLPALSFLPFGQEALHFPLALGPAIMLPVLVIGKEKGC